MFLPLFLLYFWLWLHPFHVSVCTMQYAETEQSLQITLKIFADDLEEALNSDASRRSQATYIDVLNPKDEVALSQTVANYVQAHLQITINGRATKPIFLGYEMEDLAMWCYLEITDVAAIEQIAVENAILTESFDDQVNIVHVAYKGATKSMKLASNKLSDVIRF